MTFWWTASISAWHWVQVSTMLERAMEEPLSVWGRMLWAVWHEAQWGATTRPFRSNPSPWMLSEKFSRMWSWWISRCRVTGLPSWWHLPQVYGIWRGDTGESWSATGLMSWMPWQSRQLGARGSPLSRARPWSEAVCWAWISSWQAPQSTFSRGVSWYPSMPAVSMWQPTQVMSR